MGYSFVRHPSPEQLESIFPVSSCSGVSWQTKKRLPGEPQISGDIVSSLFAIQTGFYYVAAKLFREWPHRNILFGNILWWSHIKSRQTLNHSLLSNNLANSLTSYSHLLGHQMFLYALNSLLKPGKQKLNLMLGFKIKSHVGLG